jgi:DNA-directed RNA polymerase subunit RPC12/RpoP
VTLRCPLCERTVDTSELELVPETGGGLRCPRCGKVLRYHQPYRILRVATSALISASIVRIAGIRNVPIFLVSTFVLWIPVSLFFNAYLVHFIPLTLIPWKPRIHIKTPVKIVNERNTTIELFEKKRL